MKSVIRIAISIAIMIAVSAILGQTPAGGPLTTTNSNYQPVGQ
jgi:hypothetical protein